MGKHRDHLQIIANILSVVNKGAKKTCIMLKANLSYKLLNQYLSEILRANLICENGNGSFGITGKGCMFLRLYYDYDKKYKEFEEQIPHLEKDKKVLERILVE